MKSPKERTGDVVRDVAVLLREKRASENLDATNWDFEFRLAEILYNEGFIHPQEV